jgi:methylenetetrahydrofolate reductase (NADPH)
MFFDNSKYFEFVDKCREAGITIPIIPGLKPITTKKQLMLLPKMFHIDIPHELSEEIIKCKDKKAIEQVGIEWSIRQCKELIDKGAPVLHFYTMGKSETTYEIAKEIF